MNAAIETFIPYITPLFPADAKICSDGIHRVRIKYILRNANSGRRYSKPIVLYFEEPVLSEFSSSDMLRQEEIGRALQRHVRSSLNSYDEYGEQATAHLIHIDDLICDRR